MVKKKKKKKKKNPAVGKECVVRTKGKYSGGTSKVIQRRQDKEIRKHPTKLVKAAACFLVKSPQDGNGLDTVGVQHWGTKAR